MQKLKTMQKRFKPACLFLATAALVMLGSSISNAQNVEARLSSRDAYVGMPVVFQVSIRNASDYETPSLPEIDGCEIRLAGTPSQRSQITIINGRRSESRFVTIQYYVTPQRPGTFVIPSLNVFVDGQIQKTQPMRFVATKSETGDLLFVEVDGREDRVYVGQPLNLQLKIWIKPFRDREKRITLSEANMWQVISQQSSWGSFTDRMKELAENNQRPRGQEVRRDNGQGKKQEYYLYEIDATVYPTRPGKIDASDVRIIVNYPTELGRSRDPFDDFFGSSPFGGRSGLDDDFFSSPFGRRLAITSVRPIVADAVVDSTEVVPVPTAGRPADYRGAVGQYDIITRAAPLEVDAGDPIELKIGIVGDGPMELVQAPPLSTLENLTADFKVDSQALAGFVQDSSKVFSTNIRPRREGITEIPAIPFSFFDPTAETYKTVYSDPISIKVNASEMLVLDSIQGNSRGIEESDDAATLLNPPDLANHISSAVLVAESLTDSTQRLWLFLVIPPAIWLIALMVRGRRALKALLPSFQSPQSRCTNRIQRANDPAAIIDAMLELISRRSKSNQLTTQSAIGVLRTSGWHATAIEVESFWSKCERSGNTWTSATESLNTLKAEALELVNRIDAEFRAQKNTRVRRPSRANVTNSRVNRAAGNVSRMMVIVSILGSTILSGTVVFANKIDSQFPDAAAANDPMFADQDSANAIQLSDEQQVTILKEANLLYQSAREIAESDSAEAKEGFVAAASKYQLLVDAGIQNHLLFINLGNAYLQTGNRGQAIVNFQRARQLAPSNQQALTNLEYAKSLITIGADEDESDVVVKLGFVEKIFAGLQSANQRLVQFVNPVAIIWTLGISSVGFWLLLTVRTLGLQFPVWRFAIPVFTLLAMSGLSVALSQSDSRNADLAIVVADVLELRTGDGPQFPAAYALEDYEGQSVRIVAERSNWIQVETQQGQTGWAPSESVEPVKLN